MGVERRKFQGVLNILSFNRHFYVFGIVALALIIGAFLYFAWPTSILLIVVLAFLYGLLIPLLVSAYVYDFSGFYKFEWVNKTLEINSDTPTVVNINAGFDETSFILKSILPNSDLQVFDFYNPDKHTEPAIVRARKVSNIYPNTLQIKTNHIPLPDDSVDVVFLLSAVHEIRKQEEKVDFLKECHRICKTTGQVIMVEHLRDFPNFVAFTVGFTHFFSKKVWQKAFISAGFNSFTETKFTPFMSIFSCKI